MYAMFLKPQNPPLLDLTSVHQQLKDCTREYHHCHRRLMDARAAGPQPELGHHGMIQYEVWFPGFWQPVASWAIHASEHGRILSTAPYRVGGIHPSTYQTLSVRGKNALVIELVRNGLRADGYFAGWSWLSALCSQVALPSALVTDVLTCIRVYESMRPAPQRPAHGPTSTPFRMTITRATKLHDSLHHVAPKNIGGKAWVNSDEYLSVYPTWSNTCFGLLPPSSIFVWLGSQRKTISRPDLDECDSLMLLGTVDFDLNRIDSCKGWFSAAIEIAKRNIATAGTRMQGCALAALLNYDLQKYLRRIQEIDTWVADSTGISGNGYERRSRYQQSKAGIFTTLMVCNTHDLLYDLATSNLMSSVMYADAAGITKANLHCIFLTSCADQIARRLLCNAPGAREPLFGDNAFVTTAAWAGFGERNRTWERFVKYSRQIARSSSVEAATIAEHAVQQLVLADCNLADIAETWAKLTLPNGSHYTTTPRQAIGYHPSAAPEIMAGMVPDLCSGCMVPFQEALLAFTSDTISAIEGLPVKVMERRAVARAAAIRRTTIFATCEECCDVCACRIGRWADLVSYTVLTALMADEKSTPASEWLLQCYAVWAVMTSPVDVATVLSRFDLCCKVVQNNGAMGERDVLDC
ncbi:hypothetical protein C8F04DRAFT_1187640 [Mycena alexandri]|uniref:Uncharacterized protein n=1 Tax=Mycena alexandri TaxID=1745969 RepID=A0AAD6SPG8_9AGAR|nr:hypothetical protein C8F04DRAFT_1187640 [Mycena alexandri]